MLLLAPGGVREALFSDEYYRVVWGRRIGFAHVALQSRQVGVFARRAIVVAYLFRVPPLSLRWVRS